MNIYQVYGKRRLDVTWWVAPTSWAHRDYGLTEEFGPYRWRWQASLHCWWLNTTSSGFRSERVK